MVRAKEAPSGCIIYLMLSIVINLFILILRISAHEVQNNATVAVAATAAAVPTPTTVPATIYHTDVTTVTTNTINAATTATATMANDIKTKLDDVHESAMTSTTDTITTRATLHSNVNLKRTVRMDQGDAFGEHSTTVVVRPFVARLVKNEYDAVYKDDNVANELDVDGGKAVDSTNDETLATVIPVQPNAPNNHSNGTRITYDIGMVTIQTNMQRNANISRDQLNLLGVIKSSSSSSASSSSASSSSSAVANNNATNQKQHKPDAPMLNYIFDSHLTNKHRHYDPRYGPHFDDVHVAEKVGNVTAQLGSVAYLNCRIRLLQDKTVTWLKREQNNSHIQLLTIGVHTYTFDKRFSVEFEYPNNWRLRIADTNKSDEGLYECQISTHPPRAIRTQFNVKSPEVFIVDEFEQPLADKYYEVDSTIELTCIVRHVSMLSKTVQWLHGKQMLNYDMTRGGISVQTDLVENGANSTLSIAKVRKTDGGNYTCSISPNDYHTINIQVINGESLAELYHGSAVCSQYKLTIQNWIGLFVSTIIVLSRYINVSDAFKVLTIDERRFIK